MKKNNKSGRIKNLGLKIYGTIGALLLIQIGMYVYFSFYAPKSTVSVPQLVGKTLSEDMKTLKELKMSDITVEDVPSLNKAKGTVIYSNPVANTIVYKNTPITLEVSMGNVSKMDDYKGKTMDEVIYSLTNDIGMNKSQITFKKINGSSSTVNTVIRQSSLSTNFDYSADKITFYISDGKNRVTTGSYINQDFETVKNKLLSEGLTDKQIQVTYKSSNVTEIGKIIEQKGVNATHIPDSDSKVSFVVSTGNTIETKIMPSVVGMSKANATQALEAIGFNTANISFGGVLSTTVKEQSIAEGTKLVPSQSYVSMEMGKPTNVEKPIDQLDVAGLKGLNLTTAIVQLYELGILYHIQNTTTSISSENNIIKSISIDNDRLNIVVSLYQEPVKTTPSSTTQSSTKGSS